MSNQLRKDPEERLDDYLKRCVDAHYHANPEERMKNLGVTDEMQVITDRPDPMAILRRIEKQQDQTHEVPTAA